MNDQAAGLRKLLGRSPDLHAIGVFGTDAGLAARAAAALADGLARRGAGLWVLDELPPPTNVAAQFGLHPRLDLGLLAGAQPESGAALPGIESGVHFLAAPGAARLLAGMEEADWRALATGLDALPNRPEWLLIHADPGCGAHSIALMAETRILITQARKSALTDAYGLLKQAEQGRSARRWLVLLMNVGDAGAASRAYDSLAATAGRFLDLRLELLGLVPQDARLEQAARRMLPLLDTRPPSPASLAFRGLADALFEQIGEKPFQWHDFWQKMWLFSRTNAHMPRERGMQPRSDRLAW